MQLEFQFQIVQKSHNIDNIPTTSSSSIGILPFFVFVVLFASQCPRTYINKAASRLSGSFGSSSKTNSWLSDFGQMPWMPWIPKKTGANGPKKNLQSRKVERLMLESGILGSQKSEFIKFLIGSVKCSPLLKITVLQTPWAMRGALEKRITEIT